MSRVLKVKRGTKSELPDELSMGELGYCTDTKELYIGNGIGNTIIDPLIGLNETTGIVVKSSNGSSYIVRSIQEGTGITVSNGDGVSGNPSISINSSEIDHGDLSGRNDDDHTIYSLADGTRSFTGVVGGIEPTDTSHLATKGYVDSQLTNALQKGNQAIPDEATTISVLLPVTYTDTNYSISNSMQNLVDNDPSLYSMIITSKSDSGFTVTFSGIIDSANYKLEWKTTRSIATIQRGNNTLTNGVQNVSVILPTEYNDTNYSIDYSLINTVDSEPSQYGSIITAKSVSGFTIKFSGEIDSSNYIFEWSTNIS